MNLDWLKTVAPTVASALLGPLAGVAVEVVGSALGMTDATKDKVTEVLQSGNLNSDQIAAIRKAELELKQHEMDNGYKFAELEVADRKDARNREIQTKDNVNKILAYTIVGSFIAMVGACLLGYAKVESVLAGTLVGYLSAKAEQVLAYYFGSSRSSDNKTELLAKAGPIK